MPKLKTLLIAVCAAVLAWPALLTAQQAPPANWIPQTVPTALRAPQPRDSFLGPDYWTDPVPATYRLQVAGTSLCLTRTSPEIRAQVPFIRLRACNDALFDQSFEVSPAAVDSQLWPATSNVRWRINARGECAGTARNVVFGSPRVDFNACDLRAENGNLPEFRGALDQYVVMVRMAPGRYRFRMIDGRCWTAGAVEDGAQMQMEQCDGRPGQSFQLVLQMGLAEPTNQTAADKFGWIQIGQTVNTESGNGAPDRFRRLSGLDMAGSDLAPGFVTENDRGLSCARACAANGQCRAFTWVQPGAQDPARAMCWLKNGVPSPSPNRDTVSGIVRP